ncbi:MAG: HK97 family phage prohead protease [Pseudoflavonifractor sp.]|nr:HK97 family phage prohead protease [Pseudoflavonifractor sp.]
MKRVRLTDDSINSYGSRVLTVGCDASQYERNPVLLYMHERGKVIGYIKDIKKEEGEITGEPVFDCASELSRQCKKQWEVGSLRMVSIGIDVLSMSEDPEHVLPGQTAPTITSSRIYEVSVVDIGANDNAIVMRREGKQITLGRDSDNPLPRLKDKPTTKHTMDQKALAISLGLPESADEAAINTKIEEMKSAAAEVATLKRDKETLTLSQITAAVDGAVAEKRISADMKEHFVSLGKDLGLDKLKTTLAAMNPAPPTLSSVVSPATPSPSAPTAAKTYAKLSEVPAEEIEALRDKNNKEYRRLFKAEYGYDY